MVIKSIELENFRIYKDHNQLNLKVVDGKNIYIVSGKNGFGKTTFLMSLVWCLYGRQMQDVDDLYKKEISDQGGYPKYIPNSLNNQASVEGKKQFSVTITINEAIIPNLSCNEIKIKRTYHSSKGEDLEILIDGLENQTVRELANDKVSSGEIFIRDYLLPIEIAKFFFFDAEKIVSLAEVTSNEQRRNLSKAYSEILGIKKYEVLKSEFEDVLTRLRATNASKEEKAKLNLLKAEIQNIELAIDENESTARDLVDKKDERRFESNQLQERLIRMGNTMTHEDLELIKITEQELDTKLREINSEIQEYMEIIPFAIAGGKLSKVIEHIVEEGNQKAALFGHEKVSAVSDKVITDLITEQKKFKGVITRDIQDFFYDNISKLIKKHFYADVPEPSANFQKIHDFSNQELNETNAFVQKLKFTLKDKFKTLTFQNNQVRNEWTQIRRKIADAEAKAEDPVVQADREKRNAIEKEIVTIEKQIQDIYISIGKSKQEIESKKRIVSEITSKLKAAEVNVKKDKYLAHKIEKVKEFIVKFKDRKKVSLEKHILEGLQTLMHKKGFVHDVKVDISDEFIDINLLNKEGKNIKTQALSKGEQQMYATALLHGLVAEAETKFPVFIDSPMQKFDEEHAQNIVKYFYPTVSDQVILFPLVNKELTRREFDLLEPKIAQTFLIDNLSPEKSTFRETAINDFFTTYNTLYHAD